MDRVPDTRLPWLPALAVGCLALAIGSITLGRKAFWYDEVFDAVHVTDSWADLIRLINQKEMSQSAYLLALKVWAGVVPNSEAWLRVPSVVLFALASALLVLLGTRLFDRLTGVLAGSFLATNAFVVQHAQEVRTYALLTFAVVVASLVFVRAVEDSSRRNWLIYGAVAGLSVYCHFWAGFVVVAHVASLAFAPTRPPFRRVFEGGALFALVIAPALYFTATADRVQVAWIVDPSPRYVIRTLELLVGENGGLAVAVVVGLALLAYRAVKRVENARWRFAFVAGWCAIPIALGIIVSRFQNILVANYAIVITPALALAAAAPIAAALRGRRAFAGAGAAAIAALLAMSGYRVHEWYDKVPEDWRAAAAYVARESRPGNRVVVVPDWAGTAYSYYDPDRAIDPLVGAHRTLIVIRGSPEKRLDQAKAVLGQAMGQLGDEREFGRNIGIRVFEPKR